MSEVNVLNNIEKELEKIDKKENKVYFFVLDTKGVPSGEVAYIYNLALIAKNEGYNVCMLHTEDEFVGVKDWLGEEYANITHLNVNKEQVDASPSDVLFIPEIFSQVMNQTKELPCKRVAILQNYNYLVEQMPYSAQWGDFRMLDGIANAESQINELHGVFPYVRISKVTPFISKIFGQTNEPKKMIVNIVARDQSDVKRIVKPFYWKYPVFRWVSFRELRNLPQQEFSQRLREAAVTIVVDEESTFGYSALEAMKSGSLTLCKVPKNTLDWMNTGEDVLPNCCIWFNDFNTLHKQIASVVRSWITDNVPTVLAEESEKVCGQFTYEKTKEEFMNFLSATFDKRKTELINLKEKYISEHANK